MNKIQFQKRVYKEAAKFKLPVKITDRICNMCEKPFEAKDDMRSCPTCDNLKSCSSGYATGFDEMGIGFL